VGVIMDPNDVVSALRPILQQLPSVETWYEVCRLLHQCAGEEMRWSLEEEAVVAGYLAGFLQTWPDGLATLDPYTRAMLLRNDEGTSRPMHGLYPALRNRSPEEHASQVARNVQMHLASGNSIIVGLPEFHTMASDATGRFIAVGGGHYTAVHAPDDLLILLDIWAIDLAFHHERPWLVLLGAEELVVYDVELCCIARAIALPEHILSVQVELMPGTDLAIVVYDHDDHDMHPKGRHTALTFDLERRTMVHRHAGVLDVLAHPDGVRALVMRDGDDRRHMVRWAEDETLWSMELDGLIHFHPSGESFAMLPVSSEGGETLALYDTESAEVLVQCACGASRFVFHPSGDVLVYLTQGEGRMYSAACDRRSIAPLGEHMMHPGSYRHQTYPILSFESEHLLGIGDDHAGQITFCDITPDDRPPELREREPYFMGAFRPTIRGHHGTCGSFAVNQYGDLVVDLEPGVSQTRWQFWPLDNERHYPHSSSIPYGAWRELSSTFTPSGEHFITPTADHGFSLSFSADPARSPFPLVQGEGAAPARDIVVLEDEEDVVFITRTAQELHLYRFDISQQNLSERTRPLDYTDLLSLERSADSTKVFVIFSTGGAQAYSADTLERVPLELFEPLTITRACAHAASAPLLATASWVTLNTWDTTSDVWYPLARVTLQEVNGATMRQGHVAAEETGQYVAYVSGDRLFVHRARSGELVATVTLDLRHDEDVVQIAFVPGLPSLVLYGVEHGGIRCVRWEAHGATRNPSSS